MNLEEHYEELYKESISIILSDNYEIDNLIDSDTEKRLGITLLVRPSIEVKGEVQKFLNELHKVEPNQYYYPNSDIHITVMSIISCYDGFDISKIDLSKYIELTRKCLDFRQKINIKFKGVTASPSCIMIQGFTENNSLNNIRDRLRKEFKNSDLEQSLDKRYSIQTAHSTVVRFREKLKQKANFLKIIEKYKHYDFGNFEINTLELVSNDWYQREKNVGKLCEFKLEIT